MKLFPGIDTGKERKRFAIFHTCTLIVSPMIGAVAMFLINGRWPFDSNKISWFVSSLFIWNFIGSMRFFLAANEEGFFAGRIMGVVTLIGFPVVYLYNILRVFFKKE